MMLTDPIADFFSSSLFLVTNSYCNPRPDQCDQFGIASAQLLKLHRLMALITGNIIITGSASCAGVTCKSNRM